jgi:hypothetical protein
LYIIIVISKKIDFIALLGASGRSRIGGWAYETQERDNDLTHSVKQSVSILSVAVIHGYHAISTEARPVTCTDVYEHFNNQMPHSSLQKR